MPSVYGPMTLGELIEAVEATNRNPLPDHMTEIRQDDRPIYIDWCRLDPGHFHSYRGYYDHLAIRVELDAPVKVKQFLKECSEQIGSMHTGYKGGNYRMNAETPIWVTPSARECPGFGISGVKDEGYCVILTTQNFDT